ncbi:MAG TPA: hypothetical protein VKV17_06850 [Bryobacteraceae bacterium]|nr:hypothetical protein [Bryobacteraceae bacterium]
MTLLHLHCGIVAAAIACGPLLMAQPNPSEQSKAAVLENQGRPMSVPVECTDDDIAWAGLSCTEQEPCPVYFELASVEPVGNKLFAAGNLHTEAVTLYSVLLGSPDEGKTWQEAYQRIRGAGLDRIDFIDMANGWVSGQTLWPLAQDPFLLATNDGGVTWRQQPVFEDGGPGSIQQFAFQSKDQGSLIVDRGEGSEEERYGLYETPNGGGTWHVKQLSSKPLRLAERAEKDWRVRTEAHAFQVERRRGAQWISVAAFAVTAGYCKPSVRAVPVPSGEPGPAQPGRQPGNARPQP